MRDTSIRAETPEGIEYVMYPAGLLVRACAYGIDMLLQWVILAVVNIVYALLLRNAAGIWFILLCQFVLDWFYHVIWELWFRGQSPGKRLAGIRVVSGDGSPVGPGSSMLRNLIRFVDNFMGLFLIGFVSVSASKGFRRLGDWAAGTLVVHTWQSRAPERRDPLDWLAAFPAAVPGRALSYEEKQGILMFARRYPLLGPARAGEIARPLAESLRPAGAAVPGAVSAVSGTVPGAVSGTAAAVSGTVPRRGADADSGDAAAEYLLGIARTLEAP